MLLITMNVVVVLSAMAAAFLVVAHSDNTEHQSNDQRVRALYIAEAGVNLSLGDIMAGGEGNLGTEESPMPFGYGEFAVTAVPVEGFIRIVSVGAYKDQQVAVEVVVQPEQAGGEGFCSVGVASGELTSVLGSSSIDSYDSTQGSYESQVGEQVDFDGDPTAAPGGNVLSNGDVDVGPMATVFGDVAAPIVNAPLLASVQGSTAPLGSVQAFPPVIVPDLTDVGITTIMSSNDRVVESGRYRLIAMALSGTGTTVIRGPATIEVGVIYIADDATLLIDATNGPVMIYPTISMTIKGNGQVATLSTQPKDLVIQSPIDNVTGFESSLTGNPMKPVQVTDQGEITGVVYAPDSTVVLADASNFYGSVFAKRITVTGDSALHFDESLKTIVGLPACEARTATEWTPNSSGGYPAASSKLLSWRLINPEGELSLSDTPILDPQLGDSLGGSTLGDKPLYDDLPETLLPLDVLSETNR